MLEATRLQFDTRIELANLLVMKLALSNLLNHPNPKFALVKSVSGGKYILHLSQECYDYLYNITLGDIIKDMQDQQKT